MNPNSEPGSAALLTGALHIYVAFDWGDEIDLTKARTLVSGSVHELPRRRRTPPSFQYTPAPVHVALPPAELELAELGKVEAQAGLTVFDFAAVTVALHVPFRLASDALVRLAGSLADPGAAVSAGRRQARPVYQALLPAIRDPEWRDDLSEEYFVFQLQPPASQLVQQTSWLAGLVHLEAGSLSNDEAHEALRLKISYSPDDLFIPDWAASVLIDQDCDETLKAVEFANLQLLELRHIDNLLDQRLAVAQRTLAPLSQSYLPFWRPHARPLRELGKLKMEADDLFERTGNALKLVGDQYLARVYRLVAQRFHLETWQVSIQRKLDVAEGVYQVVSGQAASYRAEFLEIIIVLLILFEVIMAFVRH
ncbi:MAG: hypothetical protein L0Y71_13945 [Gemmataceae bacterium]|nr:hypothetical protein [Gemmataceae bacterium]